MKLQCILGRIAAIELAPDAKLQGEQNSKRWILDIEHDSKGGLVTLPVQLLDWRTGKVVPSGLLNPSVTYMSREASMAAVFFPVLEGNKLFVAIDPDPEGTEPVRIRLTIDALHTLMR
jgi:hypothetical protein